MNTVLAGDIALDTTVFTLGSPSPTAFRNAASSMCWACIIAFRVVLSEELKSRRVECTSAISAGGYSLSPEVLQAVIAAKRAAKAYGIMLCLLIKLLIVEAKIVQYD
jgi:hypothetical protein